MSEKNKSDREYAKIAKKKFVLLRALKVIQRFKILFSAPALLALLVLAVLGDALFSRFQVLAGMKSDLAEYFLPMRQFGFEELRRGHLVLWNPHLYGGQPFFGNPETALLYPLNLPFLFFPIQTAVNLVVAAHIFLAGLGIYFWARRRELSALAGILAAVTLMFGGPYFLQVSIGHLSNLCTLSWVPLLFLSMDGWLQQKRWPWVFLGIFCVSMMILAGHPQTTFMAFIFAAAYLVASAGKILHASRILPGFLAMSFGGAALTAVQWFPTVLAARESLRGIPLSPENAGSFSLPLTSLLTVLMPFFWGPWKTFPYWNQWYFPETCLFGGAVAFLLGLYAVFAWRNEKVKVLAVLGVIAILLALGSSTPLFNLLYQYAPGFNYFRGYSKFGFFALLFLAMTAAHGLDGINEKQSTGFWFHPWGYVIGGGMLAAGLFLGLDAWRGDAQFQHWLLEKNQWGQALLVNVLPEKRPEFWKTAEFVEAASCLAAGAVLCLALGMLSAFKKAGALRMFLVAVAVVELTLFARLNRPTFDARVYRQKVEAIKGFLRDNPGEYRVLNTYGEALQPWGRDIWGLNPFAPLRYVKWMASQEGESVDAYVSKRVVFHRFPEAFQLLRLRYILRDEGQVLGIYPTHLPEMPRAKFYQEWKPVPGPDAALNAVLDRSFDPGKDVVMEDPAGVPAGTIGKGGADIRIRDVSTECIEIEVQTQHSGILLLGENYAHGWTIEPAGDVSTASYRVMPADYFLMGVPLAAGKHHFRMVYSAPGFKPGLWISLLTLAFLLAVLFWRVLGSGTV